MTDNASKYSNNPPIAASPKVDESSTPQNISLGSLDDSSVSVEAQYNPKELQIDKSVPWSKVNQANQSQANQGGQGIHLEFTGAEGRSMSIELLFDGYEAGTSIAPQVQALEKMASVIDPASPSEDKRRPHRCVAAWGSTVSFRCVIESLSTKYTMFSASGDPLRATCTVKLKEADVVSVAKQK
jgi:hypothetical protein